MSARDDAIKALAKVADDWGWKGGKKGELTGGEFFQRLSSAQNSPNNVKKYNSMQAAYRRGYRQLREWNPWVEDEVAVEHYMKQFKELEDAGVPRRFTGKIVQAVEGRGDYIGEVPELSGANLSRLMSPMTDAQRETFLQLLPRWTGTLEQAASAAKKLYRKPPR